MRIATIAGIALLLFGVLILVNGGRFTSSREVLSLGDLKISAEERHPISPWIAGVALLGGAALVVTGRRRRA